MVIHNVDILYLFSLLYRADLVIRLLRYRMIIYLEFHCYFLFKFITSSTDGDGDHVYSVYGFNSHLHNTLL